MRTLAFVALLFVACAPVAGAADGKCAAGHFSMLKTGVVSLGETVIDYPIEKVWAVLPYYHEWSSHHQDSQRTYIRGEPGKVGETVRVHQAGAPSAFYVETIRIRPPKTIDGAHKAGNMAWKISDLDVCFVRFNDFSVREYNGKTIFARSVYEALAPGAPKRLVVGRDQLDGKPDPLHSQMASLKTQVEAYIRNVDSRKAAPGGIASNSDRQAYFGDLHHMSGLSFTRYFNGAQVSQDQSYRFARGEPLEVEGQSVRRKSAPIDFFAITEPVENIGLFNTLNDPNSPFSRTAIGQELRDPARRDKAFETVMEATFNGKGLQSALLGLDPEVFKDETQKGWQQTIAAANGNYQPGKFTTFVGYHWTAKRGGTMDRVVLFRGDKAPQPFTSIDSQRPEDLWTYMESNREQGYDVLAIPHHPNLSNGRMFNGLDSEGRPIDRAYAARRATNEPLVEISNKGQAETHPGLSPADEFASYELFGKEKMETLRGSYVRDALGRGLEIGQHTGVNPFNLGFVGSSDYHNGLTDIAENFSANIPGTVNPHQPATPAELKKNLYYSPGSLTGVWAEQNTRAALFAAFRRKETFATSGTRMKFRFFAGWHFDTRDPFKEKNWVQAAYRDGVAMGGALPARPAQSRSPTFVAWATKDPAGANLERLQIVKLWLEDGRYIERVHDVALSDGRKVDPATGKAPASGKTVDAKKATYTNAIGAAELKATWTDPQFSSTTPATYYLRVIEIPTPRWSTHAAVTSGVPLADGAPTSIQERGWSSPIWFDVYVPLQDSAAAAPRTCSSRHKAMLQTGTVAYGEVIIDRPIDEVWSTLPEFYRWSPVHSMGTRKTIRGEVGEVGEVVEIVKAGANEAVYSETVRIQPPRTIDGSHRSGHIVWKVYDREGCFARYSDFGVREYQGKTIFYRSVYGEIDPATEAFRKLRNQQAQGQPDSLDQDVIDMRTRMLEYLNRRG